MLPSQAVLLALSIDVLVLMPIFPNAAKQAEWQPIIPLVVGALVAIPLGAWVLVMASPGTMQIIISIMVLLFALLLLSGWSYNG